MPKKTIALVTASCFLFSSVISPAIHAAGMPLASPAAKTIDQPLIPASLGRITSGASFGSSAVVINIQDLHCHAEVQRNIARILEAVDERYKLGTVYVEGASGQVDTSWLSDIRDRELKNEIVDTLLEQGELTGTEYYSIIRNRPGLLAGLEDAAMYRDNLLRLNRIMGRKAEYEKLTGMLKKDLAVVKHRFFNRSNRRIDRIIERYRKGDIDAGKFYRVLGKFAHKVSGEDYGSTIEGIDLARYENITGYLELLEMGRKIKYKRVARQLQEFVKVLKDRLPFSAYNLLLEKTDNFSKNDELYICLSEIAREYKLDLRADFRELDEFLAYIEKGRQVNPLGLIREEKKLIEEVRTRLSGNTGELEVSFISDFYAYFEDYLNNRLSAGDYEYFEERFEEFRLLWAKYADRDRLKNLDGDLKELEAFYRVNVERNRCFMASIGDRAAGAADERTGVNGAIAALESGKEAIVVVTGGFHTQGLERLLDERRITHLTITPNVTQDTNRSDKVYAELARQQARILSATLAPMLASALAQLARGDEKGLTPEQLQARCSVIESLLGAALAKLKGRRGDQALDPLLQGLLKEMKYFEGFGIKVFPQDEGKCQVIFHADRQETLVYEVDRENRITLLGRKEVQPTQADETGVKPGLMDAVMAGAAGAGAALGTIEIVNQIFREMLDPLKSLALFTAAAAKALGGNEEGLLELFEKAEQDLTGAALVEIRGGQVHINPTLMSLLDITMQRLLALRVERERKLTELMDRNSGDIGHIILANPWIKALLLTLPLGRSVDLNAAPKNTEALTQEEALTRASTMAEDMVRSGRQYHAHGTNANTLRGILRFDGKLLPSDEIKRRGGIVLSGESIGTTNLNKNVVSTINLKYFGTSMGRMHGYINEAVGYARYASGKGHGLLMNFSISPANIDYRINELRKFLAAHNDNALFARLEPLLPELISIKKYFDGLDEDERNRINTLSRIPIVVIGYDSGKSRVIFDGPSSISGEDGVFELTATIVVTTPENIPAVRALLDEAERNDIKAISFDEAKLLQNEYLEQVQGGENMMGTSGAKPDSDTFANNTASIFVNAYEKVYVPYRSQGKSIRDAVHAGEGISYILGMFGEPRVVAPLWESGAFWLVPQIIVNAASLSFAPAALVFAAFGTAFAAGHVIAKWFARSKKLKEAGAPKQKLSDFLKANIGSSLKYTGIYAGLTLICFIPQIVFPSVAPALSQTLSFTSAALVHSIYNSAVLAARKKLSNIDAGNRNNHPASSAVIKSIASLPVASMSQTDVNEIPEGSAAPGTKEKTSRKQKAGRDRRVIVSEARADIGKYQELVITAPIADPVIGEALDLLGKRDVILHKLRDVDAIFVRDSAQYAALLSEAAGKYDNLIIVKEDSRALDIAWQLFELLRKNKIDIWDIRLQANIAVSQAGDKQDLDDIRETADAIADLIDNFFSRLLPGEIVEKIRRIARDKTLTLNDLTNRINVSYFSQGTNKLVFKINFNLKNKKNITLTALAFKKGRKSDGVTLQEIEDMQLLQLGNFDFIPVFLFDFVNAKGIRCYIEEFIEGKTAFDSLDTISPRDRGRIVEAVLRTGWELGGVPADIHGKNFIIDRANDRVVFVDIGNKRLSTDDESDALSIVSRLIGFYGYPPSAKKTNDFVFDKILDRNVFRDGERVLRLAHLYGNEILRGAADFQSVVPAVKNNDIEKHKGWIKTRDDLAYIITELDRFLAKRKIATYVALYQPTAPPAVVPAQQQPAAKPKQKEQRRPVPASLFSDLYRRVYLRYHSEGRGLKDVPAGDRLRYVLGMLGEPRVVAPLWESGVFWALPQFIAAAGSLSFAPAALVFAAFGAAFAAGHIIAKWFARSKKLKEAGAPKQKLSDFLKTNIGSSLQYAGIYAGFTLFYFIPQIVLPSAVPALSQALSFTSAALVHSIYNSAVLAARGKLSKNDTGESTAHPAVTALLRIIARAPVASIGGDNPIDGHFAEKSGDLRVPTIPGDAYNSLEDNLLDLQNRAQAEQDRCEREYARLTEEIAPEQRSTIDRVMKVCFQSDVDKMKQWDAAVWQLLGKLYPYCSRNVESSGILMDIESAMKKVFDGLDDKEKELVRKWKLRKVDVYLAILGIKTLETAQQLSAVKAELERHTATLAAAEAHTKGNVGVTVKDIIPRAVPKGRIQGFLYTVFQKLARAVIGMRGPVVYYPFGGSDPFAAFTLPEGVTDVFAMGIQNFGPVEDMVNFFKGNQTVPTSQDGGFDSVSDIYGIMYDTNLSGYGVMAMWRIISLLKGDIRGVYYFDLKEDGSLEFASSSSEKKCRNAVVEYYDLREQKLKRYWYLQDNVYADSPFERFIERLQFQTMLIKGAPGFWDIDINKAYYPGDTLEKAIERRNRVLRKTVLPAKNNNPNAKVIADVRIHEGARVDGNVPHPIFAKRPNSLPAVLDRGGALGRFGYGNVIFYAKARDLIDENTPLNSIKGYMGLFPSEMTASVQKTTNGAHAFSAVSGWATAAVALLMGAAGVVIAQTLIQQLIAVAAGLYVTMPMLLTGGKIFSAMCRSAEGKPFFKRVLYAAFSPIALSDGFRSTGYESLDAASKGTIDTHESFRNHFVGLLAMLPGISAAVRWYRDVRAARLARRAPYVSRQAGDAGGKAMELSQDPIDGKDEDIHRRFRDRSVSGLFSRAVRPLGYAVNGIRLALGVLHNLVPGKARDYYSLGGKNVIDLCGIDGSRARDFKRAGMNVIRITEKLPAPDGGTAVRKPVQLSAYARALLGGQDALVFEFRGIDSKDGCREIGYHCRAFGSLLEKISDIDERRAVAAAVRADAIRAVVDLMKNNPVVCDLLLGRETDSFSADAVIYNEGDILVPGMEALLDGRDANRRTIDEAARSKAEEVFGETVWLLASHEGGEEIALPAGLVKFAGPAFERFIVRRGNKAFLERAALARHLAGIVVEEDSARIIPLLGAEMVSRKAGKRAQMAQSLDIRFQDNGYAGAPRSWRDLKEEAGKVVHILSGESIGFQIRGADEEMIRDAVEGAGDAEGRPAETDKVLSQAVNGLREVSRLRGGRDIPERGRLMKGYGQLRKLVKDMQGNGARRVSCEFAPANAGEFEAYRKLIAAETVLFGLQGIIIDAGALDLCDTGTMRFLETLKKDLDEAVPGGITVVLRAADTGAQRAAAVRICGRNNFMRAERWDAGAMPDGIPQSKQGVNVMLEVVIPENADEAAMERIVRQIEDSKAESVSVRYVPEGSVRAFTRGPQRSALARFLNRMKKRAADPFKEGYSLAKNIDRAFRPSVDTRDWDALLKDGQYVFNGKTIRAPRLYLPLRVYEEIERSSDPESSLLSSDDFLAMVLQVTRSVPGSGNKGWRYLQDETAVLLGKIRRGEDLSAREKAEYAGYARSFFGFYACMVENIAVDQYLSLHPAAEAGKAPGDLSFEENAYADRAVARMLLSKGVALLAGKKAANDGDAYNELDEISRLTGVFWDPVRSSSLKTWRKARDADNAQEGARLALPAEVTPDSADEYIAVLEKKAAWLMAHGESREAVQRELRAMIAPLIVLMREGRISSPHSIAVLLRIYFDVFSNYDKRLAVRKRVGRTVELIIGTRGILGAA